MADNDSKATVGAMMLVAGGIIGAALAILYTPQSGPKTRRQIVRYARKVRNEAEEMIRDAAESITETVDDFSEKTSELIERGGDVAEDWRHYLLDSIDRGQKELEKQRKKLSQWWG